MKIGEIENGKVRVPVTNYVFKYLAIRYGEMRYHRTDTPYVLNFSHHNDLRMALGNMGLSGKLVPPDTRHIGKEIILDLGESRGLVEMVKQFNPFLKAGMYFFHEFVLAMRFWVDSQETMAASLNIRPSEWNRQIALQNFLDQYQITEIDYDFDSAYRQLTRRRKDENKNFLAKIRQKFDFHDRNNRLYKLAKIKNCDRDGLYVEFYCYSQSDAEMKRRRMIVPKHNLRDQHDEAERIAQSINHHLVRGYCLP